MSRKAIKSFRAIFQKYGATQCSQITLGIFGLFLLTTCELSFVRWENFFTQVFTKGKVRSLNRIDRATCCLSSNELEDVCHRLNCTEPCPEVKSAIPELDNVEASFKENAFFLETLGDGTLDIRQACAVESLALHNPNLAIYVLFTGGNVKTRATTLQTLKEKYANIHLIQIDLDDYLAGTPLEHWYHCTDWRKGPYHVSHLSDALRFLTIAKYGGYYLDLDIMFIRPMIYYRNFVAAEDGTSVASGAFHADSGHPIMQLAVDDFALNYQAHIWTHNGPALMLRMLKKWCEEEKMLSMNFLACKGYSVLPSSSFYPVHYTNWKEYFTAKPENVTKDPNWLTKQVVGVHIWNKLSSKEPIYKNSTQLYNILARSHCPKIFSIAPDIY